MPSQTSEPVVKLDNIDIVKEDNLIISDLSLSIYPTDFVYIVGRVGSGKTSIIKTLIGEIPVTKGAARVVGFNLRKLKERSIPLLRRKLGVVFQDFQLLSDRSVYDNLRFVLESTGWRRKIEINRRIEEKLESVGMLLKSHKMPHQLSGGEQQRVAIARALLNNPPLILADEPTGNLDSDTAAEIMELILRIHRENNSAVIMVTHNRSLFKRYPGRVLFCENLECREITESQEIDFTQLLNE
ncbi:MAG: ATP-binding cassette domain-containing protein [Bacteroidales bacterium]|nr:ATP-binding cassette domain-containing protein [Bacteroidales bacterium]MDD3989064.1 ATP-binding cassette domain-containing protein [Bacteroidales bacterium]MDD4639256.1 ATP-binding cassette domain-containing protein [Bacteroidales bacterium]